MVTKSEIKYYVYLHRDITGIVILVGKGKEKRVINSNGRPPKWLETASTYQIVKEGLNEIDALRLEKELIKIYDSKSLLNKTKKCKIIDLSLIKEYVEYSESSPTNLIWKKCTKRGRGALTGVVGGTAGCVYIGKSGKSYGKRCIVTINGYKNIAVHRIIWMLFHGVENMDVGVVDHIDGNPLNNNINNLRLVTDSINQKNRKSGTSSGHTGITWLVSENCYRFRYTSKTGQINKRFSLINHGTKELAFSAAVQFKLDNKEMLLENGYSERYINGN